MNAAVKILLGFVMIAIGLGLFVDSIAPILDTSIYFPGNWLDNFLVVLTGTIPAFLILIGLFVVWLEIDELKVEREIKMEEKKEKEEEKSKKGKKKK